jgi:outer membrane protein OmpA-like peptidoglycan-associated protein/tetratricopeptide (TPR) repeat protein
MRNTINTLLLIFASIFAFAQNVEFKSANFKDKKEELKKAQDDIENGDEFWKLGNEAIFNVSDYGLNYKKAVKFYYEANKFNPSNGELNFKIGVCLINSNDPSKGIAYIKKARELDPKCNPFLNYYYGVALQLDGKFTEAIQSFKTFEDEYRKADNFSKFIFNRKEQCERAAKSIETPIRAWIDNVSELNTSADDIAPSISTDGAELIMSSNRSNTHTANDVGEYDFDIYSSSLTDGAWSFPRHLTGKINSADDDVSNNLSYDGTKMLLHRTIAGQSDIYEAKLVGADWTDPAKLNAMISSAKVNEKNASYNDDGYRIYFTRDNDDRSNGMEIMYSGIQSKMKQDFMAATMISTCNSKFNEGPIYISIDGETMYIASEGHTSLGGYDIFVSKKEQGQWTKPVNLGYPINTQYDDFYFAPTANGKYAYISSNRPGGSGGYDIYKVTFWGEEKQALIEVEDFLLASLAMPIKDNQIESTVDVNKKSLTVFKGITIDAISRKAVEATIEITDNTTGKIIETFTTNSATGKFIITLNSGKNYGIAVKAAGYLFHSENFDIPAGSDDNLVNKTIELKNIAVGSKIALRNIFFDFAKSSLRAESNAELDRLVKLMKDVPNLKIEISGHTDNTGSAVFNDALSQQRAEAVVNYLTSKGIVANRMVAKGYGSNMPIATNKTEEGKQQNRRTEFEIKGN